MSTVPEVSVVIPAYNTSAYIADAVASVLAQTYTSYEIIVVNDGSPDTPLLEQALAPFRDRLVYLARENRGASAARNTGIRTARGRYIATLDSDDVWEPDYLATQKAVLDANPSLDVVYPNALIAGDHPHAGLTFMDVCPSKGEVTFEAVLTQKCHVFTSVLARREALERAGLFDETLRTAEDFELWLRVLASGGRIGYHHRVLVRFRKRRDSLSADPVRMAQQALNALDKTSRMPGLAAPERAAVERQQRYFRAQLELARGKHAFFRLDARAAREHIDRANEFFKSRRLRVVSALIGMFPGVLLRLYRLRDRLIGADTSF